MSRRRLQGESMGQKKAGRIILIVSVRILTAGLDIKQSTYQVMQMKCLPLLCCLVLLAGCGPTSVKKLEQKTGAKPLSPKSVLKLVDGNTLFLHSFNEDSYLYFDHSGKIFGKDIYNNKDLGRWDVSEDAELCMRMTHWWYGDLLCYQVLASGGKYHLATGNGVVKYNGVQYPGDAKHLYFALKKKKKSYRHSMRAKNRSSYKDKSEITAETARPEKEDEQFNTSITEQRSFSQETGERNIRSTVKWMARDCPGCNLAETDLKKADLVGAQLAGANLKGALLRMANLRRADLQGADLAGADLSYANLPGADLREANLTGANLKGANLIKANLTGATIKDADFTDALLESVRGLPRQR